MVLCVVLESGIFTLSDVNEALVVTCNPYNFYFNFIKLTVERVSIIQVAFKDAIRSKRSKNLTI
jgi:hypothetical protein